MKIPDNAQCVFNGEIFDVYQWQQKMYDGSYQTFEILRRPDTVEVIAVKGDKILLSKQSQPTKENFYSLFGGRAEKGEEPLTTAKRELLEESGLESSQWNLYKSYEPIHKIDWHVHVFIAKDCKAVASQQLDAGEKIEVIECSFEEFITLIESDNYWGLELKLDILQMKLKDPDLKELRKVLFENE